MCDPRHLKAGADVGGLYAQRDAPYGGRQLLQAAHCGRRGFRRAEIVCREQEVFLFLRHERRGGGAETSEPGRPLDTQTKRFTKSEKKKRSFEHT